ncbi:MAG TPA: tetratricopeptide repeat protein, partial [Blastocatellia bacterium]|nr:tetratricopeptide repeat protein [Blastocatellia bacterium]
MANHHFISYSSVDALDFALQLADALEAGPPQIPVWLDKRELQPGHEWDEQIVDAIRVCDSFLFVMTCDSVEAQSVCKHEWSRALAYKKTIIPIKLHADAEMPMRLGTRQHIDFTGDFDSALAKLRKHIRWMATPEGTLQAMKDRLADAQRDLRRAVDHMQQARIQDDIDLLEKQVAEQQQIVNNPQAAAKRVEESIKSGLERERKPEKSAPERTSGKFINPPPAMAPSYFQDRFFETTVIGGFLKDNALRLMTVVGRGGTGKTAIVCRLLKSVEGGQLPDDGGPLSVDGIVYLSAIGTRRVTLANLYADLCKLLPGDIAAHLDSLYKKPQASTEFKMQELLANFSQGRVVVLLDNFEDLISSETLNIRDAELDEALRALLSLPQHAVKVILTTRIPPRDLALFQPGRQRRLDLDEGLESPYAENILREMDADGKVGLKIAPDEMLNEARERTRGYPRALEALFAILSADRDTSLRDVLDDTEKMLPENVVKDLVGEAFSRLDPTGQQVMQALAVYGRPVVPAAIDYLLQPYLPSVNSAPVLNRLVNMQFARKEAGRYYQHPVDYAYAFSRLAKGEESDRDEVDAPPYTQFALLHRAANYFEQARTSREEWKTIEDLAPQLAEFDLRCTGQDYDTAASVLLDIDFDYLFKWSFYRLVAELHERLQDKITDPYLKNCNLGNLGSAYYRLGRYQKAIACYEHALIIDREAGDRLGESIWLGCLGNCYADLGQTARSIDYSEQSIELYRAIGDSHGEAIILGNLGNRYAALGQTVHAIEYYKKSILILRNAQDLYNVGVYINNLAEVMIDDDNYEESAKAVLESIEIGKESNSPGISSSSNCRFALARLCLGDLPGARAAAEAARQYDEPKNNHYVLALLGLIALRQQDCVAAQEAFAAAVTESDQLLDYSMQNFAALDSKGLALCGLALCDQVNRAQDAIEVYKAARAINKDAGIVNRVLRLFDALAVADDKGLLAGVRDAAGG